MKSTVKFISLIISCLLLQGCAGDSMNKQGAGTLIGGVAGGLIGSKFGKGEGALLATGLGAVGGALIGGSIGKSMDEQDRKLASLASQNAFENSTSGSTKEWRNPDNGNYGSITPQKAYQNDSGQYCREYTQTVVIGGETSKAYGTACRQPDGQWKIVK
jgi:surface antigen